MSVYSDNDRAFQAGVKDFFEKEGITHVVTLTHANVVERFIRTMKNMMHDRVRFNRGSWTVMFSKALDKYNDTERQEYNSKWSNQSYKIVKIEYDDVGNRTFKLEGLNKPYLRHEILKV